MCFFWRCFVNARQKILYFCALAVPVRKISFSLWVGSYNSVGMITTEKLFFWRVFTFFCVVSHTLKIYLIWAVTFFCECTTHRKIFFWRWTHRKYQFFWHHISVCIFLSVHRQKNIFLTVFAFFCVFLHPQKKARFQ